MSIKLVAVDLDGTLLDSSKRMPPDFIPWVKEHSEIKTVIASGRQYHTLVKDFPDSRDGLYIICENGAQIVMDGEIIFTNPMRTEDVLRVLEILKDVPNAVGIVCGVKSAYLPIVDEYTYGQTAVYYAKVMSVEDPAACAYEDDILKVAVYFKDADAESGIERFRDLGEGVTAVLSGDSWIDVARSDVDKGSAIKFLLDKFGICREEACAFGDYLNDKSMLEVCGESYCMENGHPDLKAIAKHIAPSNDEDGVMRVLRHLNEN